jgi:Transposase DDE domain
LGENSEKSRIIVFSMHHIIQTFFQNIMSQNSKKTYISVSIINSIKTYIESEDTCALFRQHNVDFTRDSTLTFAVTIYYLLTNMTNSLDVELWISATEANLTAVTKSAFSQRRYLIKSDIFVAINKNLVKNVYTMPDIACSKWHGFILTGIDGSVLTVPNTTELSAHFGTQKGGSKKKPTYTAQARNLVQYDVLNQLIIRSELRPITVGERDMMYNWIPDLQDNSISVFDRGFGSFLLFSLLNTYKKPYIARLKVGFNNVVKAFVASGEADKIVTFKANKKLSYGDDVVACGTEMEVRLLRVILPDGTVEVLATSLLDQEAYPATIFGEAYNLRWGVETCFDILKNKWLALCFSGHKVEAIYQDIYASVILFNIHQIMIKPAQVTVNETVAEKRAAGKNLKNDQKVNNNVTIGILQSQLFTLWTVKEITPIIEKLTDIFATKTVAVRKNRTTPRKKTTTKRNNATTQTNYRRAA